MPPVILINRTDISDNDISAKDSATGLVQRNGNLGDYCQ